MDCKEAQEWVVPFVKKELPKEKLEAFLHHIRNCKECREELEIYYTVNTYVESLDRDWFTTYNLKGAFEAELRDAAAKIRIMHALSLLKDLVTGLAIIGIVIVAALQLQSWGIV